MTEDKKKDTPHADVLSTSDADLSDDPFSEDHEVTQIETTATLDLDSLSELSEVTEKSFVTKPKAKTPTIQKFPPHKNETKKNPSPALRSKAKAPELWRWFSAKLTPILIGFAFVIFIGLLYVINIWLPQFTATPQTTNIKKDLQNLADLLPPQDFNLKLSAVTTPDAILDGSNTPQVLLGGRLAVEFSVVHWQTPPQKELEFLIRLKIFDPQEKLIVSLPNYKRFFNQANPEQESILIENEFLISPKTQPGSYRIQFDIVDAASQKTQNLQSRFHVLNRRR